MIQCKILCLCGFVGTPRPTVTLDTAEEEEATEPHNTAGIKLSNLEFSVFGDYAVVPSIEVTMLLAYIISLYGAELATSSIKDKATTASITRRVGVISRSKWTHLFSQSRAIPSQSILWSESQ